MRFLRLRSATVRDDGVIAVIVAIFCVVLFLVAALAVDISNLIVKKQSLQNSLDAASASGATKLPKADEAYESVLYYLDANDITVADEPNLAITTWCVVPSTGGTSPTVDTTQIPPASVCTLAQPWPAYRCNDSICAIPCATASTPPPVGSMCNAIKVVDRRTAPFVFGPVVGDGSGDTGAVTSGACRGGTCGGISTNPLNIAVLVDRTQSTWTDGVVDDQVVAIKTIMQQMQPATQSLAIGTMGKSLPPANLPVNWCKTVYPPATDMTDSGSSYFPGATRTTPPRFWNDFLRSDGSLDVTTAILQQLACVTNGNSSSGTQLAAPLKAAARAVLGLGGATGRNTAPGTSNVVFILTDGQPNEKRNLTGSTNVRTDALDPASTTESIACDNFTAVATSAKANDVTIVTIGYGDATKYDCKSRSTTVRGRATVLAGAASPPEGSAATGSVNDYDCSTPNGRTLENSDADYYFCAATGSELSAIFTTALAQVSGHSRLIQFP